MARTKQIARTSGRDEAEVTTSRVAPPGGWMPRGTKGQIRNLYKGPLDMNGHRAWTVSYPKDLEEPVENRDSAQYALVVRNEHCYDGRRKLKASSIMVQSSLIKTVLGEVLNGYPGITTNLDRLQFNAPFEPFVHRWEKLIEAREKETDTDTRNHINLLYDVLEEELRENIREKDDLIKNGVGKSSLVRFEKNSSNTLSQLPLIVSGRSLSLVW